MPLGCLNELPTNAVLANEYLEYFDGMSRYPPIRIGDHSALKRAQLSDWRHRHWSRQRSRSAPAGSTHSVRASRRRGRHRGATRPSLRLLPRLKHEHVPEQVRPVAPTAYMLQPLLAYWTGVQNPSLCRRDSLSNDSAQSRSGPRSQLSMGMPKPFLGRSVRVRGT